MADIMAQMQTFRTFTSFENAFNNGHLVMANVVNRCGASHVVTIGGRNEAGELWYKDSATGNIGFAPEQCFGADFIIEITGTKLE